METNRTILRTQLEAWRMEVCCAEDGPRALDRLREAEAQGRPFHVAILDMQMPGMDGLALARVIHGDPAFESLPIVLLTSMWHATADADELRRSGILARLHKPVKERQLHDGLVAVLRDTREPAPPFGVPDAGASQPAPIEARGHVLIVDDNLVNQRLAAAQLRKLGFTSDVVGDGSAALEALELRSYDSVLMDCQMPVMDGFEATAEIRRREAGGRRSFIVALTANAMTGDEERCLAAGMDAYVSKPLRIESLRLVLERVQTVART